MESGEKRGSLFGSIFYLTSNLGKNLLSLGIVVLGHIRTLWVATPAPPITNASMCVTHQTHQTSDKLFLCLNMTQKRVCPVACGYCSSQSWLYAWIELFFRKSFSCIVSHKHAVVTHPQTDCFIWQLCYFMSWELRCKKKVSFVLPIKKKTTCPFRDKEISIIRFLDFIMEENIPFSMYTLFNHTNVTLFPSYQRKKAFEHSLCSERKLTWKNLGKKCIRMVSEWCGWNTPHHTCNGYSRASARDATLNPSQPRGPRMKGSHSNRPNYRRSRVV